MRYFRCVILCLCASQFIACRVKQSEKRGADESEPVEPSELIRTKSFSLSPPGTPSTGFCSNQTLYSMRDGDRLGQWAPMMGSYILTVPLKANLALYFNLMNPSYQNGSLSDVKSSPYVWQTNYDTELRPQPDGSVLLVYPDWTTLKFLNINGALKAQDGSRQYVVRVDANTYEVHRNDETGSYDTYSLVTYSAQDYGIKGGVRIGSDPCIVSPLSGTPASVCRVNQFKRFLFQKTTNATDLTQPISVSRNAFGYVTGVFNMNGKQLLKISYNTNGKVAIFPIGVQDASEIPLNRLTTRLEWNYMNSAGILTKINDVDHIGKAFSVTFNYVNGLQLRSITSNAPGNTGTTTFRYLFDEQSETRVAPGFQLTGITRGTYTTKFKYRKYTEGSTVRAYTVDVERYVVGQTTPNTVEKLALNPTTCKIEEYVDAAGLSTVFTRNAKDPELIDIISNENDKAQSKIRLVRRGSGDAIQSLDLVEVQSAMKGSSTYQTVQSYDIDLVSGLVKKISPYGDDGFATIYQYDDLSEFAKFGTRVKRVMSAQSAQVWSWMEYVYDDIAPFRLREIRKNGSPQVKYNYQDINSKGVPLSVAVTYPAYPQILPQTIKVDEFGDWISYDTLAGIKVVRDINAQYRRVEKVSGFNTLMPTYNSGNPNTIDKLEFDNEELSIDRPDSLSTRLRYRGMKTDSSAVPTTTGATIKPNGLPAGITDQEIPIITDFQSQSQP